MKRFVLLMIMMLIMLAVGGIAYAAQTNGPWDGDYYVINGTADHDWESADLGRNHRPPCNNPLPCTGDIKDTNQTWNNKIYGKGGWDYILARGGNDKIWGGNGMDQPYGHEGGDTIYGEAGHDHLWGGNGHDYLDASDGADEPGEVEEIQGDGGGDQTGFGNDHCVIDEDPNDGAFIYHCETLVIKDVAGVSGGTPLYTGNFDDDVNVTLGVGTHNNVNMTQD